MGNTIDAHKKKRPSARKNRRSARGSGHGHSPAADTGVHAAEEEDDNEEGSIGDEDSAGGGEDDDENQEENLEKFITTDADLQQRRQHQLEHARHHGHGHRGRRWSPAGSSTEDVKQYPSSVFAPVAPAKQHFTGKGADRRKRIARTCCYPVLWIFGKIWKFVLYLNRAAANPVWNSENVLNGCIFAAVVGFMLHTLQIMCPMANDPVLRKMYFKLSQVQEKFEYVMFTCNILVVMSGYSIIWQTCGPYLFLSPLYMLYLIYSIAARHTKSIAISQDCMPNYAIARTIEQSLRLLFMMWQFCVVMAYTRQVRANRHARDTFIKARRRRLDFISKTRRHEDRKQFLRDPVRQKTVLLLADPKRPWLKQTMAAKLAERAFSENEAIAALWGPSRRATAEELEASSGKGSASDVKGLKVPSKTSAQAANEAKKKWFGIF